MTVWAWEFMGAAQQAAALAECGPPPSGCNSVLWALVEVDQGRAVVKTEWRWKAAIWPNDVRQGVELGRPAKVEGPAPSKRRKAAR